MQFFILISRRTTFIRELTTFGIKNAENLALPGSFSCDCGGHHTSQRNPMQGLCLIDRAGLGFLRSRPDWKHLTGGTCRWQRCTRQQLVASHQFTLIIKSAFSDTKLPIFLVGCSVNGRLGS